MEYRVLGPLEVHNGQGSLPLAGAKQRTLLALLLVHANHVLARDRLIDELWGDHPPKTAVQSLQVYISRLRKLLPPETLLTRAPGYLLEVEPDELDLRRFERLLEEGREALAAGDPKRASAVLHDALSLWRGSALAEFGSEPFARSEAGRLEDLRLVALEERIEADLALGRHAELIGGLETAIAENPYRERLYGQLVLALYRSGRQAEALDVYRDARAALDQLGIEPSAALKPLEKQILTHAPTLDLPRERLLTRRPREGVRLPGALVPTPAFPFVGRATELVALRSLLARAQAGEGALVLLTGEPGAGKTRLARELAHEAAAQDVLVLYGSSDAAVSTPYQPLREWLEFLLHDCDPELLRLGSGILARLVPELEHVTGPPPPPGEADSDRYLLQSAALEHLTRLSRIQPLLLVIDDLHWADGETLQLLRRLARGAPEARLLLLAAYRDPGETIGPTLSETLADLSRLDGVTALALDNLSLEEVGAFIHASTGVEPPRELAAEVGEFTDGTPLLLCEFWRDLQDSGAVEVSAGGLHLLRPVTELRDPHRVGDVVHHRLSRLSPGTIAMIELAAVAGPRFELRVLADAAGLGQGALVRSVEEAVRMGMIEELPEPQPACRFTHELVRRAVYDRLPRVRLPELHLSVGEALEHIHADDARVLPELAHHFTLAAPLAGVERGVEYNLRAAETATTTFAYDEAAARLSSALELGIADPLRRAQVQAELGLLLYHTGRPGEAEAILSASLDAATSLEERGLAARALVHLSNERLSSDPGVGSAEIVPIAEEAVRTFERLGDSLGLAEAENLLAHALGREGRTEESFAMLDGALAHADAAGNQVLRRAVIGSIALRLSEGPTPAEEAIDRLDKLRSSTRNDPVLDAGLRRGLALVLAMAGRFEEAREHILASSAVMDSADQTQLSGQTRWLVAEAKALTGDLIGAEQEFVAQFLSMRDRRGQGSEARALNAAAHLALLCCDQGRWDEAAEYLAYGRQVDESEPPRGKAYAFLRLAARARLAAHRGQPAEALELAQRAVELTVQRAWLHQTARVWLALAEVQRVNGNHAEADASVAAAIRLYEAKGNIAALARLRARVA